MDLSYRKEGEVISFSFFPDEISIAIAYITKVSLAYEAEGRVHPNVLEEMEALTNTSKVVVLTFKKVYKDFAVDIIKSFISELERREEDSSRFEGFLDIIGNIDNPERIN